MTKLIKNKNVEHVQYLGAGGLCVDNSTESDLLVAECISDKRRAILQGALDQADLSDDVVFVTAFEALSGYYEVTD